MSQFGWYPTEGDSRRRVKSISIGGGSKLVDVNKAKVTKQTLVQGHAFGYLW